MNISFFLNLATDTDLANKVDTLSQKAQTSILDLANYSPEQYKDLAKEWIDVIAHFGLKVLLAIVTFLIGRWIITKILTQFDNLLRKRSVTGVAISLFHSLVEAGLFLVLFMIIAGFFGVTSVTFAALLGAMGLAVGMALSGQLQNLAGGIILLVTRPFSIGHFIDAQSAQGTVEDITLFHTLLKTPDNKMVFLPNGNLSSGSITNLSHTGIRRVDFSIGVEYGEDFEKVQTLLMELANADQRVLKSPAPVAYLGELAESSVNISFRIWTKTENYWDVYFDFNKIIYNEFNKAGIGFPFPQLTVHQA